MIATRVLARAACTLAAWGGSTGGDRPDGVSAAAPRPDSGRVIYRICRITAYCDRGRTASGVESGVGQCAAPDDIPFGATVHIPELDLTLTVTDRTAPRFRANTIDVFIPRREDCIEFGVKYLECRFVLPAKDGLAAR